MCSSSPQPSLSPGLGKVGVLRQAGLWTLSGCDYHWFNHALGAARGAVGFLVALHSEAGLSQAQPWEGRVVVSIFTYIIYTLFR